MRFMLRYRFVEAIQYTGDNASECIDLICRGGRVSRHVGFAWDEQGRPIPDPMAIQKHADVGDWVVRGVSGYCHRMTDKEFHATYEEAPNEPT